MDNWIALFVSIVWHHEITPEQAIRHVEGTLRLASPRRIGEIDEATIDKIHKIIGHNGFRNIDKLERDYGLHRCDMCNLILQRYGVDSVSVCGDKCKELGISFVEYKDRFAKIPKGERESLREKVATQRTQTAKAMLQSLSVGQTIEIIRRKRSQVVTVISKNDRMLSVIDDKQRIDTIHLSDFITKEVVVK